MAIDTQSFPLKILSEPIDNAAIILHLSLFVNKFQQEKNLFYLFCFKILSPGRENESHLSPPPLSPSSSSIHSFDGLSASATNATTDVKRGVLKESPVRASFDEDSETRPTASVFQHQVNISGIR
jgi:hypothetical protein